MDTKPHIAFIGLGSMGTPMALNLLESAYPLTVFNRSPEKTLPLEQKGAHVAKSPADAVRTGGIVITMLSNDEVLEAVCLGEGGFLSKLGAGGVHISMSTVSPDISRRLAEAHAKVGSQFVAAPVFGRPDAAAGRKLFICQSGAPEAKARVAPILTALSQGVFDFGERPGAANVIKLCGNFMILSAVEAMGEALLLGEKNGLDRQSMIDFFGQTNFSCPVYKNYGRILAERAFSEKTNFKLELGVKDIRLAREAVANAELPRLPLVELLYQQLTESLALGRGQLDWTAIEMLIGAEKSPPSP